MALLGKDEAGRLRREIQALGAEIDADERAARQFDEMADRTDAKLDELARLEAAGELTPDQVSRQVDEIAADVRAARLNADQKRRVAELRRVELTELERVLERLPYDAAVEQLRRATASRTDKAAEFAKTLRAITKTAALLGERRKAEAELRAEAERLRPAWLEADLELPDEEEFPAEGIDTLIALLQAGPFAPNRDAASRARKAAAERAGALETRIRDAVEMVSRSLFADREHDERELRRFDIPDDRRATVLEAIAARRAQRVAKWERENPQQAEARRQRAAELAGAASR
jgi:hypothetical protein